MSRRIPLAVVSLGVAALLSTGCSSDDGSTESSDVTTTADVAATTVADSSSGESSESETTIERPSGDTDTLTPADEGEPEAPAPCVVLTAEEFGAVMGGPGTATEINEGEPACELALTAGGTVVRLNVMVGASAEMATSGLDPAEFQSVDGVGEELMVSSEGRLAVMRSGDIAYRLTRWEGTFTPEQLTELMRSIVAG